MYCEELHSDFIKGGHIECPLCNKNRLKLKVFKNPVATVQINDSHTVCTNCGAVNDYLTADEFVDFYENMDRIKRNMYRMVIQKQV